MSDEIISSAKNTSQYFENIDTGGLIIQIFFIVGTIASILGAFYLIHRIFHVKISATSFNSFFDADTGDYIQERLYSVKWGSTFKRPIHLPHKFNTGSRMQLWYKPTMGPMDSLTQEHYKPETKSNQTKIHLFDKRFYKENEVENIRVKTTTRLNHQKLSELMDNITTEIHQDRITVLNQNEEFVKNYPVNIPSSVPASKGWEYMNTIDAVVTYRIIPGTDPSTSQQNLVLLVNLSKNTDGGRLELPILI